MPQILNDVQHSYFSVDADLSLRDHFELRMLEENRIPGLLRMSVCDDNGKLKLNYDITGRISLAEQMEHKKLRAAEVRLLLLSLKHIISGLSPYLLKAEGILLTADTVYLDPISGEPSFLYQPNRTAPFSEALTAFLEVLLSGTDRNDYKSLLLVYCLLKESADHPNALERLEQILISQNLPEGTEQSFRQHEETIAAEIDAGTINDNVFCPDDLCEVPIDEPLCIRDADNPKSGLFKRLFPK